jgi:hypothetical protein
MTKKEKEVLSNKLTGFLNAISELVGSEVVLIYINDQEKAFKVETTLGSAEEVELLITQAYKLIEQQNK